HLAGVRPVCAGLRGAHGSSAQSKKRGPAADGGPEGLHRETAAVHHHVDGKTDQPYWPDSQELAGSRGRAHNSPISERLIRRRTLGLASNAIHGTFTPCPVLRLRFLK